MRPKQQTLAVSGFERYRKRTRREQFLAEMYRVVVLRNCPITPTRAPTDTRDANRPATAPAGV